MSQDSEREVSPSEFDESVRQAFEQGIKNVEFTVASAQMLSHDTNQAINLIGGAGVAAIAYGMRLVSQGNSDSFTAGIIAVGAYLLWLVAILQWKCSKAAPIMPPYNEARNLLRHDRTAAQILAAEISGLDYRGDYNRDRNAKVGYWLNRARRGAFYAPGVFLAAWLLRSMFM